MCVYINLGYEVDFKCLNIFFVGHEPHQFLRYYPRVTVCLIYSPVLWPRYGSTGSRSDESIRDGGTTSDAEPVPHVSGKCFLDYMSCVTRNFFGGFWPC